MAPREETSCCTVRGHSWIRLILSGVGMPESYPARREMLVKFVGLVEVFACEIVLFNQEVVAALHSQVTLLLTNLPQRTTQ